MDATETQLDPVLSAWIDTLVDYLVAHYEVIASPTNRIVLGRYGSAGKVAEYRRADMMEEEIFGDRTVTIPGDLREEIFSRLVAKAHRRVQHAQFHPRTTPGYGAHKRGSHWNLTGPDLNNDEFICHSGDTAVFNIPFTIQKSGVVQLGVTPARGRLVRVLGVLADGDVAYPCLRENTLLVPCKAGEVRNAFCLVELQSNDGPYLIYAVYAFTAANSKTGSVVRKYLGTEKPSYFPYTVVMEDGTIHYDVLRL